MKQLWIVDYETIMNCFMVTFESLTDNRIYTFTMWNEINHIEGLLDFLEWNYQQQHWHITYNGLAFDSQLTEYLLEHRQALRQMDAAAIAHAMYEFAQHIIDLMRREEYLPYRESRMCIPSFDLFKINHWDAKKVSLKWVQYGLDWWNMEEMPHPHNQPVLTLADVERIAHYNRNDTASTKQIILHTDSKGKQPMKDVVNLRYELSQKYPISLYNASETRVSKEMFLHFLSGKLGIPKRQLSQMRTIRSHVTIAEVLIPWISFQTPEFQSVHEWFKGLVVEIKDGLLDEDENSKGPKFRTFHKTVPTDYGLGGLHGCTRPGIYKAETGYKIMSADVTSFYPNLSIRNGWAPAHIEKKAFTELYEWFFEERKKYPKSSALNYVFKIILNATYGLSKSWHSFLYDPFFTFQITVNGQLLLSMLYEEISMRIPNSRPLMQNTDGFEMLIPEEYEDLYYQICKNWEQKTQLALEFVEYDRMIIRDVNNYIAVYKDGSTKCKGFFEFEDIPFHKNKSYSIIARGVYNYFIKGILPEETLQSNRNIFDYCAGIKVKGDWHLTQRSYRDWNTLEETKLSKVIRYYVSSTGGKLYKCHRDGRSQQLESTSSHQTIYNQHQVKAWEDYQIDEQYYLDEIWRAIKNVTAPVKKRASKSTTTQKLELQFVA